MPTKTSIQPMLSVRRSGEALEFYQRAFGAEVLLKLGDPDKGVVAQLSVEGAVFWIAEESPEHKNFSPETLNGATTRMVLVVDDPQAMFDRAIAAGAKVVVPVKKQEFGWLEGRALDPYGHHWEIGKPLG